VNRDAHQDAIDRPRAANARATYGAGGGHRELFYGMTVGGSILDWEVFLSKNHHRDKSKRGPGGMVAVTDLDRRDGARTCLLLWLALRVVGGERNSESSSSCLG